MPSYHVEMDRVRYIQARQMLVGIDKATLNLEPAWREISIKLRAAEVIQLATAAKRASRSKAKSHKRYLYRKKMGWVLNGRGDRARPGAGPLTVTGRVRSALLKPQDLEIHPLEMYQGVRIRDFSGRYTPGGVGYVVPLQNKYTVSKRPTNRQRAAINEIVLAHIARAAGLAP